MANICGFGDLIRYCYWDKIFCNINQGVIAFGIKKAIDALQQVKFDNVQYCILSLRIPVLIDTVMQQDQRFVAFLVYYSLNVLYALISCTVVLICGVS